MGDRMKMGRSSLIRKLVFFAAVATLGAVAGAVFIASKFSGDEQVISDIDRHFEQLDAMKVASPTGEKTTTEPSHYQNRVKNDTTSETVGAASRRAGTRRRGESRRRNAKAEKAVDRSATSTRWQGIQKVAPKTYIIDNQLITKVRKRPRTFINGIMARLVKEGGQPIGYRLHGIGKESAIHAIDLRNGDILLSINGFRLNGIDEAILAAGSLRNATKYRVDLKRGERRLSYYYRIK